MTCNLPTNTDDLLARTKVLGISATRYLLTHSEAMALLTAARAEGARRERGRIRALPLTNALEGALHRAAAEAMTENAPPGVNPAPDWSALLAAITEQPASPVTGSEAATEGER